MWILLREPDNCFAVVPASDVECIATRKGQPVLRVGFRSHCREAFTDVLAIEYYDTLEAAIEGMIDMDAERACRVCGCTDEDCSQCIEKTGTPCSWVAPDLCSACVEYANLIAAIDLAEQHPQHGDECISGYVGPQMADELAGRSAVRDVIGIKPKG